jgi:hypothetical protein
MPYQILQAPQLLPWVCGKTGYQIHQGAFKIKSRVFNESKIKASSQFFHPGYFRSRQNIRSLTGSALPNKQKPA